jgi:hypothetical protein
MKAQNNRRDRKGKTLPLINADDTDRGGTLRGRRNRRHRRDRKGKTLPLINADDTDREEHRGVVVIAVIG